MTNLPRERWPAEKVMALYRCRWQIELLFKELGKSHNRLEGVRDTTKSDSGRFDLGWLLALLVKRRLALDADWQRGVIDAEDCQNSALWLMPILASIIHGAWQEITEKLEWAMVYLSKTAKRVGRENPSKNNTLDGIINSVCRLRFCTYDPQAVGLRSVNLHPIKKEA